ncbi:MAG: M23 family metallopeptidase [Clostridia bacterium]|nr:M23 family metallopeptidase [Clostridia bacterium]
MNENHENNTNESLDEREPLTKRIAKFSAFIYLGLAITVVIVATVGIFSISYDYETSLPSVSVPEVDFEPDTSLPQNVITPPEISDTPVGNEQSGVDAEVSDPESPRVMFYRPVNGEIIKKHSMDKLVFSETMKDYRVHSGIDIAANVGTEVAAFTDGVITAVTNDYFNGTTVAITHEQGVVSYYMNLDSTLPDNIAVGLEVLAGQVIGKVGNTSRIEAKDAPHLHFELHVDGAAINPETELP